MKPLSIHKNSNQGKAIDLLNKLVKINNDRMLGYETASTETDEVELHCSFADFSQSSHQLRQELAEEIISLGGTPTETSNISGTLFRIWMDIKAALTGRDFEPILSSCDTLNETAIRTYRKVLKNTEALSMKQQAMVSVHIELLKADHSRLVFMRNAMVIAE
jgi:uncharacterized protein (TIGR02284 family)